MEEYKNISKELQRMLGKAEELDWSYTVYEEPSQNSRTYVEMGKYSPAGKDFLMIIDFDAEDQAESFLKDLWDYADNFDIDGHVEMWLPERGKGGCPATARELVEDAEAIVEMIKELYGQLDCVQHPEKSLHDGGIVKDFEQKQALKEAIWHYERLQKENKSDRIRVVLPIVVTREDIDDIMVSALEGGITYWCNMVKVDGRSLGEYASEQISRGGTLILHDMEENRSELLTKKKLLQGIRMYAEQLKHRDIFEVIDHELHIDCGMVDAEVADAIIQYAIFSDVIYG